MIRKIVPVTASLTLALALGACGGGTTDTDDVVVVDDPAAIEPTDVTAPEAVDAAAAETVEDGESAVVAVEEVADEAMTEVGEGWTAMQGDWQSSAGLVKDRWADLTEEEILGTGGDRDQLVVLVQEKYGIERDQAEQEVNDWAAAL